MTGHRVPRSIAQGADAVTPYRNAHSALYEVKAAGRGAAKLFRSETADRASAAGRVSLVASVD